MKIALSLLVCCSLSTMVSGMDEEETTPKILRIEKEVSAERITFHSYDSHGYRTSVSKIGDTEYYVEKKLLLGYIFYYIPTGPTEGPRNIFERVKREFEEQKIAKKLGEP